MKRSILAALAVAALAVAALAVAPLTGAQAAEVTLKLAFPAPPQSQVNTWGIGPWIKDVEKATGGALEIKLFAGPSLANFNNAIDRVTANVAQIAFGVMGPYGNQFPKSNVAEIPFLSDSDEVASVALWRLYQQGILDQAYERVHPLALFVFPGSGIHTHSRINSLDDLKGMKMAVFARASAEYAQLLGATPVTMTPAEAYQATQRGLVQSIMVGWSAVLPFKLQEVVNFHLQLALGQAPAFVFMNKDAHAALPEKLRKVLDEYSGEPFSRRMGNTTDRQNTLGATVVGKMPNHTIYKLPAAQSAIWRKRLAPVEAEWVKRTPNGAKILAAYKAELAKLEAK